MAADMAIPREIKPMAATKRVKIISSRGPENGIFSCRLPTTIIKTIMVEIIAPRAPTKTVANFLVTLFFILYLIRVFPRDNR